MDPHLVPTSIGNGSGSGSSTFRHRATGRLTEATATAAAAALCLPPGIKPGKIQPLPVQVFYNLPDPISTTHHHATSSGHATATNGVPPPGSSPFAPPPSLRRPSSSSSHGSNNAPGYDNNEHSLPSAAGSPPPPSSWRYAYATLLAKPQDVFVHRPVVVLGAGAGGAGVGFARRARQRQGQGPSSASTAAAAVPLLNGRGGGVVHQLGVEGRTPTPTPTAEPHVNGTSMTAAAVKREEEDDESASAGEGTGSYDEINGRGGYGRPQKRRRTTTTAMAGDAMEAVPGKASDGLPPTLTTMGRQSAAASPRGDTTAIDDDMSMRHRSQSVGVGVGGRGIKSELPQSYHDDAGGGHEDDRRQRQREVEVMGSVSLKAVLRAVCLASPEILLQLEPPSSIDGASDEAAGRGSSDVSVYAPVLGIQPPQPPSLTAVTGRRLASSAAAAAPSGRPGFSSPAPPGHSADWQQASSPPIGGPSTPQPTFSDRLSTEPPAVRAVTTAPPPPPQEGKGLLTWVLDEADPGKSLVKGRLVRSPAFLSVPTSTAEEEDDDETDGLQALLKSMERKRKRGQHQDGEYENDAEEVEDDWGLQVFITLKTLPVALGVPKRASLLGALFGKAATLSAGPSSQSAAQHAAAATSSSHNRRESWTKPASKLRLSAVPNQAAPLPTADERAEAGVTPSAPPPPSNPVTPPAKTARFVNTLPITKSADAANGSSGDVIDLSRQPPETPKRTQQVQQQYGELSKSSPNTIMMMAQTLLANPTLERIDLVQKMVGKDDFVRLVADMGVKLPSTSNVGSGIKKQQQQQQQDVKNALPPLQSASTTRSGNAAMVPSTSVPPAKKVYVCDNCRTTETSTWRVKQLPGGKERRVCNDCGVYFNKTKKMRPKELWDKPSPSTTPQNTTPAAECMRQPIAPKSDTGTNDILATPRKRTTTSTDPTLQTPRRSTRLSSSAARPRSPDEDPGSSPKPRGAGAAAAVGGRTTPGRAAKSKNIVNSSSEMIPPSTRAQKQMMTLTKPNKATAAPPPPPPAPSSPPFQPAPESSLDLMNEEMDLAALLNAEPSEEKDEAKFTQKELELLLALTANPEFDMASMGDVGSSSTSAPVASAAAAASASHLFNLDDVLETSSPWEAVADSSYGL